jgi:hypothetical protein
LTPSVVVWNPIVPVGAEVVPVTVAVSVTISVDGSEEPTGTPVLASVMLIAVVVICKVLAVARIKPNERLAAVAIAAVKSRSRRRCPE